MKVGYARYSTVGQDIYTQKQKLLALGVAEDRIYTDEGFTGKTMSRVGLETALEVCRDGDEFVVPSMDRLARNASATLAIMQTLGERGIKLVAGGTVYDPHDPMAKMFFTMLAAVAEAEGGWISIRTKEAMARPSVRRKLHGKQPKLTPRQDAMVERHFVAGELDIPEIAAMFNVSRSSIYRAVDRHRARALIAADGSVNDRKSDGVE